MYIFFVSYVSFMVLSYIGNLYVIAVDSIVWVS